MSGETRDPEGIKPRSLRFTWSMKTTSAMDPNDMMKEIRKVGSFVRIYIYVVLFIFGFIFVVYGYVILWFRYYIRFRLIVSRLIVIDT